MKNYYDILSVDRNVTTKELKRRTFELGKKYHPKKAKTDNQNTNAFCEIIEAYTVLESTETRDVYNWVIDHDSGKKVLREIAINSHRKTIISEARRGYNSGVNYTKQPFWIFRDDMKSSFWWNITSIFHI